VEDMTGLIAKAPVLTIITAFGLISMILPPFGVLVTKLISIEAAANNPFIVILLVLGSALTTLYYIKWLGTILAYPANRIPKHETTEFNVYAPLWVLSLLVLVTTIFVAPLYNFFVSQELKILLPNGGEALNISIANISSQIGGFNNNLVFVVIAFVILVFLLVKGTLVNKPSRKNIYMCGENNLEDENMFRTADGSYEKAVVGNYYLNKIFDENLMTRLGALVSISLILIVILGGLS
jgi:ech hydrogenase subunit A